MAADDFGRLINPMIVEGQVHGGLAQGIGQALLEGAVYDASGQLVTASFMDYTMPRADDLPSFKLSHTTTLCPGNPLGVKGCGEAGAIGASAAVINAITDAIGNNQLSKCRRRPIASGMRSTAERETHHVPDHLSSPLLGRRSRGRCSARARIRNIWPAHTLIPVMKQRLASPSDVIDLGKIKELIGIEPSGDGIMIKAATTHYDVASSEP